jgi:DNA-binding transcriptional ArsR family regulator
MTPTREVNNKPSETVPFDLEYCRQFFAGLFHGNFFKCLNDETRQKIILLVGQYGEDGVRVGEIAEQFELDRTTISHHLTMLRDSSLVSVTRKGKERYYSVNIDYIIGALEEVVEIFRSCRENCR